MKKLMIAAAAAAMIGGAFAECSDFDGCIAYDLTMSLKTLGPKKLVCKADCKKCGEEDTTVAYLDNVSHSIKGVIWACDWVCDCEEGGSGTGTWLAAIYDTTAKKAIIPFAEAMTEGFLDNVIVYGKKAKSVAANIAIVGVCDEAFALNLCGVSGSVGTFSTKCAGCTPYIKTLSGYAVGTMAAEQLEVGGKWTTEKVCIEKVIDLCGNTKEVCVNQKVWVDGDLYAPLALDLCDVCCFDSWCTDGAEVETVPAAGTFTLKYNSKYSKLSQDELEEKLPDYALECAE